MSGMQPWAIPGMAAGYHLADVNDYSGNSRTLTNNSSVAFGLGKFGNCAIFSGNNYLSRTDNAGLTLANDYTVLMWVMATAAPASGIYAFLYQNRLNGGRYHQIAYCNDGGYKVRIYNTGTNLLVTRTLTTGRWYFFTIKNTSDSLSLFIDGAYIGTAAKGGTSATATDFCLGGAPTIDHYFTGKIDEVELSSAMTNQQIRRLRAFQKGVLV